MTGGGRLWFGQRRCPNRECRAHVFVVMDTPPHVILSYPPERIDFDPKDIPKPIVDVLDEALTCQAAGAFTGAAMLVRKTLEHICDDRGAAGSNLKDRLTALRNTVILPPPLFDALDNLRLLGNDAAHIEAKAYNNVGQDEVSAAVILVKEVLKGVYQYDALLKQLTALRKPTP